MSFLPSIEICWKYKRRLPNSNNYVMSAVSIVVSNRKLNLQPHLVWPVMFIGLKHGIAEAQKQGPWVLSHESLEEPGLIFLYLSRLSGSTLPWSLCFQHIPSPILLPHPIPPAPLFSCLIGLHLLETNKKINKRIDAPNHCCLYQKYLHSSQ